jgi:hypothetical protein
MAPASRPSFCKTPSARRPDRSQIRDLRAELCDHRGDARNDACDALLRRRRFAATLMPTRRPQADRMGALPPRYSFFLNPHRNERFTRCPRCKATMRVRKIPLVIHVDSVGLVLLRKTCRLCVGCEMLIAHEAEVDRVIAGFAPHAAMPSYLVLGTLGSGTWRDGMSGGVTLEEVKHDMADFKAYMRVEITPRQWIAKGGSER